MDTLVAILLIIILVYPLRYDLVANYVVIDRACDMDERCHTFSFGHYHQAPGASCGILYILVLSLVLFMQSLYPLYNKFMKFFICTVRYI